MIGHQRDILATLGIDIWIPKDVVCQSVSTHSIWRDQAALEEYPTEIVIEHNHSAVPIISQIDSIQVEDFHSLKSEQGVIAPSVIKETQSEPLAAVLNDISVVQIAPFQFQALGLPNCVIVADVTEISSEQQQLWHNIQQAFQSEYYELQWPFPFINFQDGRGAESYIKGFIDTIAVEKAIICLGSHAYMKEIAMIELSSLQEMLEHPLLKKNLWQKIDELKKDMSGT